MVTFSRLQRIKERKRQRVLYRKIIRVGAVLMLLVLVVLLYATMAFQKQEVVDQKEKSIKTEVAGVRQNQAASIPTPTLTPIPTSNPIVSIKPSPTLIPTPTISTPTNSPTILQPKPEEKADPILGYYKDKVSSLQSYSGAEKLSVGQGGIKFKLTVDSQDPKVLILGNFNGENRKNAFIVFYGDCTIGFDSFDKEGQEGDDDPNIGLDNECLGKSFEMEFQWSFTGQTPVKRIYVNRELKKESFPKNVPSEFNPQILIGPIQDIQIQH
mgnify:CR=1 FL=1